VTEGTDRREVSLGVALARRMSKYKSKCGSGTGQKSKCRSECENNTGSGEKGRKTEPTSTRSHKAETDRSEVSLGVALAR
jgi:hypothetical protein